MIKLIPWVLEQIRTTCWAIGWAIGRVSKFGHHQSRPGPRFEPPSHPVTSTAYAALRVTGCWMPPLCDTLWCCPVFNLLCVKRWQICPAKLTLDSLSNEEESWLPFALHGLVLAPLRQGLTIVLGIHKSLAVATQESEEVRHSTRLAVIGQIRASLAIYPKLPI